MNTIQKLAELFSQFPGIGPRQSKRFVYFLLTRDEHFRGELARLLAALKEEVAVCDACCRFFTRRRNAQTAQCALCASPERQQSVLMVVEKDVDLEAIEKSGVYKGLYFVLGGRVPILEKNPDERIRAKKLLELVEQRAQKNVLKEVILALSLTSEGENTIEYLEKLLTPFGQKYALKISTLGRGLSTGTELEYSDKDTIKNALESRKGSSKQ